MTDHLLDRAIAAVGDQYLIEGEIGRGGMAVVYRALDLRLHRRVALKVLPPELAFNADVRTRFLREAQTSAQLSHPHIVPIYGVDERAGIVYFVMSLVEGESLAARLARSRRLELDQARRTLAEVADALDYAHRRGVVHRDIKPDNILLERGSGRALVTDFGIARAAAGDARLTLTGVAVGTPAYMSPEQALGERELDGRSDLYSLGVVGYQMLAGQTPFTAANTPAMLVKHVSELPRPMAELRPDIPAALALAIDRALAKRPEDRWPDAAGFREALLDRGNGVVPVAAGAVLAREPLPPATVSGGREQLAGMAAPQPMFPLPPAGFDRAAWRRWAREQRRMLEEQARASARVPLPAPRAGEPVPDAGADAAKLTARVVGFRRSIVAVLILVPVFFAIGVATHAFPVFFFPSLFAVLNVVARAGWLWADGVSPVAALRPGWRQRLRLTAAGANRAALDPAASLVPSEVLQGAHGAAVKRAAADRAHVAEILAKLGPTEREMLPDIMPTVNALVERVAGLATTVHRLDADVSGSSLGALDERIAGLRRETATAERDRRSALLERQRATLHDLLERRRVLVNQLESASIALQTLTLDLLKLRSAGVTSALEDVTSATREARALSRDIGHLLDAANDVRKL
ncbi:MAG TPA: protein kinase [Gemmatimonadaceae bacterium]|nr:protein kinase [Gemmatimonadaceae bacterium]